MGQKYAIICVFVDRGVGGVDNIKGHNNEKTIDCIYDGGARSGRLG